MSKSSRREFIHKGIQSTIAVGIAGTAIGKSHSINFPLQQPFQQTPLPYAYAALEPIIDAATMEIHYSKHAAAYTKNLNEAIEAEAKGTTDLEMLFKKISSFSPKLRNNGGGHYNHELFWKSMQASGSDIHEGELKQNLISSFGSMDQFKSKLTEAALGRFGSGWAWLYLDENKKLQIGSTPNQDNPWMDVSPIKGAPVLGLDVWEHAYYLKYQNRRAEYVANWFKVVNWKFVEDRFIQFKKQ
jgi:Fe-Mn family superoxide dismutase